MFRARAEGIEGLIEEAMARVQATERAHQMLDAYSYALNQPAGDTELNTAEIGRLLRAPKRV
jgi:hypothetical protein